MHRIEKSVVVPYKAARMYELVADVESYPAFLPGCTAARTKLLSEHEIEASLQVSKGPFQHWFTTRNTLYPPERIELALVDGPFKHLAGEWSFRERAEGGTLVSLELEFNFSNRLTGSLLAPAFGGIARRMVTTFADRARELDDGVG